MLDQQQLSTYIACCGKGNNVLYSLNLALTNLYDCCRQQFNFAFVVHFASLKVKLEILAWIPKSIRGKLGIRRYSQIESPNLLLVLLFIIVVPMHSIFKNSFTETAILMQVYQMLCCIVSIRQTLQYVHKETSENGNNFSA